MSSHKDDLDLLLSLREGVLDTPPGSPSPHSPGYLSENTSSRRSEKSDMSVFRDAVLDFLDYKPKPVPKANILKGSKASNYTEVEKFSGFRIRNRLISVAELGERFSDVCFIQLSTMKNLLVGDTLLGLWATVGVLTEKGTPKTSSTGKNYSVWKVGCLDGNTVSLFLFGEAYQKNWKEQAGTVFALFNCAVRKDAVGTGFSLSVDSLNPEGICMVDSLEDRTDFKTPMEPLKLLSVEGLRKTLSNAGKVMTRTYSQGIRFLTAVTGKMISINPNKESTVPQQPINMSKKRKSSTMEKESSVVGNQQSDAKSKKAEQHGQGVVDKTRLVASGNNRIRI